MHIVSFCVFLTVKVCKPHTVWLIIFILLSYASQLSYTNMLVRKLGNNFAQATAVFVYCISTYADPAQRVVTNLLCRDVTDADSMIWVFAVIYSDYVYLTHRTV